MLNEKNSQSNNRLPRLHLVYKIVSDTDRDTKAFICQYDEIDDNGGFLASKVPFLLDFTRSDGTHSLPIPENCPLEDYLEQKTNVK